MSLIQQGPDLIQILDFLIFLVSFIFKILELREDILFFNTSLHEYLVAKSVEQILI